MKNKIYKPLTFIFILALIFFPIKNAQAHPADIYAHTVNAAISQSGLQVEWIVKPGPLLTNFLWNEMDSNQDGSLSENEVATWGRARTARFTASLDDKPLPLLIDSVQLPADKRSFQAGEEFITFHLSVAWPQETDNVRRMTLANGMETQ